MHEQILINPRTFVIVYIILYQEKMHTDRATITSWNSLIYIYI